MYIKSIILLGEGGASPQTPKRPFSRKTRRKKKSVFFSLKYLLWLTKKIAPLLLPRHPHQELLTVASIKDEAVSQSIFEEVEEEEEEESHLIILAWPSLAYLLPLCCIRSNVY